MNISAIITAAGFGHRFGEKKQFKLLNKKPLYQYSLNVFLQSDMIDEIILVVPIENKKVIKQDLRKFSQKKIKVISGGTSRIDSVKKGVISSSSNSELVVIHDAARPFVTKNLIKESIIACRKADGSIIALPTVDTVKYSSSNIIEKTINRKHVWLAQTPQAFNKKKLLLAYKNILNHNFNFTDESSIMEKMGFKISIVIGSENNFKVTTHYDWDRARASLR